MLTAAVTVALSLTAAACDAGDGTRLQTPVAQTTLPPPDTAPLPSVALDDGIGEAGNIDPVPPGGELELEEFEVPASTQATFQLFAPWVDGAAIDARYTCDGLDIAPALSWNGVPEGTAELAIVVTDQDDLSSGQAFIHWVIGGIDPSLDRLDEGAVPPGALQGINFFGDVGYSGPCPPPGETHEYRFTLYALEQQLEAIDGSPSAEILDLVTTVSIGAVSATVTATR